MTGPIGPIQLEHTGWDWKLVGLICAGIGIVALVFYVLGTPLPRS